VEVAMKAAILVTPGRIEMADIPAPEPGPSQVLVRLRGAGICGSDYAVYSGMVRGPLPLVLGHEAVGEIAALGARVSRFRVGERVTLQPNFACGECDMCRSGRINICRHKVRLGLDVHGVFAEYVVAPEGFVWALPEDLPDETAVFAEPLSVALHGFRMAFPNPGERVLVYGVGVIGLLVVQLAVRAGAEVSALDIAEPRLAIAGEMGAKRLFRPSSELEAEVGTFSVVYETSGTPQALGHSIVLCAPGGTVVLTGLAEKEYPVHSALITRKELSVRGSMIYVDEFPAVLDLLKEGKVRVAPLLTERRPLHEVGQALADFRSPQRVKTVIAIS
jgi:2-desacetyl-2-hydroxyethyl bacteriochlorophyllide A dehydrogenase